MSINGDLLSAVVQSSATILAVVAGLITSSVLSLEARRESAVEQVAGLTQRLATLTQQRDQFAREAETVRIDYFLLEEIGKILSLGMPLPDASAVQQDFGYGSWSDEAFRECWERLSQRIVAANEWLTTLLKLHGFQESDDLDD